MPTYYETKKKQVSAELDYKMDWASWLETGDTIATSTWTVPGGITGGAQTNNTTSATIIVSGGTIGTTYPLVNTITTANGLIDHRTIGLQVISDSPVY